MNILIISEFFPLGTNLEFSGGVEARNFFIAKHLAKKHNVTIITSRLPGSLAAEKIFGFKVIRVGNQKYRAGIGSAISRMRFIKEAISVGKKQNADIVEGTNFITHFVALKIAGHHKVPCVAWYPDVWVGDWFKNAGWIGIFGEILERYNLSQKYNAYIAISKQTAEKLSKLVNIKPLIIPCGVDEAEFKLKVENPKTSQIITISRLVKYKNIRDLILAVALLRKSSIKVNLKIIGTGPEEKRLQQLVTSLKLGPCVSFDSNLSRRELLRNLKASSVFCLPSSVEGFGISVLEACAAGIPCALSDLEVFGEITHNWKGSLVFPVHDIYKMKTQLKTLLTDKKIIAQKEKEALALAKLYSWEGIAGQTEKVYKSVLNKK